MSGEVVLPQKYALVLLRKLAGDDQFRVRYETSPALSLRDIGVPEELLARLSPDSLKPIKLADKSVFLEGLMMLIDETAFIVMCLVQPHIRLLSPTKSDRMKSSISFEAPTPKPAAASTSVNDGSELAVA